MKYGISFKIDLDKVTDDRVYQGKKGRYLTVTSFVDTENKDEFGNNGSVQFDRKDGEKNPPFCGNAKVFWSGQS